MGQLAAEYGDSTTNSECITCYLTADTLGSTRLMTNEDGAAVARYDYLPFGQEIYPPESGVPVPDGSRPGCFLTRLGLL